MDREDDGVLIVHVLVHQQCHLLFDVLWLIAGGILETINQSIKQSTKFFPQTECQDGKFTATFAE